MFKIPNANEIHVWQVNLDRSPSEFDCLSRDEQERKARFKQAHHRNRFGNGRNALRLIIQNYLQIPAAELRFTYGVNGKPTLSPNDSPDLHFNVSHSESFMLAAFSSTSEIGVDVEMNRKIPDEAQIVKRFFEASEREEYFSLPPNMRTQAFFNAWTRKEAFVKARGDGLQIPLDSFSVSLDPREPCVIETRSSNEEKVSDWSMADISSIEQKYTAALASKSTHIFPILFDIANSNINVSANSRVSNQASI